jgi:hypothetical protein
MSDTDPAWIEPMHDYLGFVCENCGRRFAITDPLNPIEFPADKPIHIGAPDGQVPATCTHCGHLSGYPIDKLIRFSQ